MTGWRTLAEPTYAVSRFGRAVEFPTGTVIRSLNPPTDEPFPGAIRVVAAEGSPFECEKATVVRPDGTSPAPVDVPALWWVTASALRFEETEQEKFARFRYEGEPARDYEGAC